MGSEMQIIAACSFGVGVVLASMCCVAATFVDDVLNERKLK